MSYDLVVYTRDAPSESDLVALIESCPGLKRDSHTDSSSTIVRGLRRRYSFTLDGPDLVEAEDIPDEIAGSVLGVRHHWIVCVEGSSAAEVPHAKRFARRLAQEFDGAVFDQQTDELWTRSKSRVIVRPEREERVSAVELRWICLRDNVPSDVPERYIEAVTRFLPEALPRRFGEYEPFQGKYAEGGAEGFVDAWRRSTSLLFLSGSLPVLGGAISAGPAERFPTNFWSMSLTLLRDPLEDDGWRQAVRSLFINLADGLNAFFASAQVTRGHIWTGRSTVYDGYSESPEQPLRRPEGWMGLHPYPMWWTWLGGPYRDVAGLLPKDRCTETNRGTLFESSETPRHREELDPLHCWVPADFFAEPEPNERQVRPMPLSPARNIPVGLQVGW